MHKFEEARLTLSEYGITVQRLDAKRLEIQADSVEEIAKTSVRQAARDSPTPIFVEDAGLFVSALKGFPSPFSSYVHRTIGTKGVLKLLEGVSDRRAEFRSAVAFCAPNGRPTCFLGVVSGEISTEERGTQGFGFDPIFEPVEGKGRTFAEMTTEEKNRCSHRARAMRRFAEWYRRI